MLNQPVLEVWAGMSNLKDTRLITHSGRTEDRDAELKTMKDCTSVVSDATALFTLAVLNLLEEFQSRFERIVVPQALVDDLQDTLVIVT